MGTLLHSCAEVHEPIELSFGLVSGVGQALMYSMEVHVAQGERVDFGVVSHHWPYGFNILILKRNVFDSCMKSLHYFRMHNMSLEYTLHWLFEDSQVQDRRGGL